jgi:HEAT repeat protein
VSAIASSGSREQVERLVSIADRTDDTALRAHILQSLLYSETADLEGIVDRSMRAGTPELEATAAAALGRMGTPEARDRLVDLTASDNPSTRQAALQSLSMVGGTEAEAALTEALYDPEVAWVAVSGLQQLGTEGAREALISAATGADLAPEVRASVLHQVPWLVGADSPRILAAALRDPDEVVRQSAVSALESVGSTQAAEELARVLDDPEATPEDLAQAAAALRRVGGDVADRHRDRIESLAPATDTGIR